jgi:cytochrome b
MGATEPTRMRAWDLPTRLFHWSLALCICAACLSAHRGGAAALRLHFLSGYAVLALVGFRLLWGFAGTRPARFASFVRGPGATLRYARSLLSGAAAPRPEGGGHNPLGAWSILALLAVCLLQAASGLFARDDIASEGPLAQLASEALVDRAGAWHARCEPLLYALLSLHLAAIAFHAIFRRENLVGPMITGTRSRPAASPATRAEPDAQPSSGAALVLLALSAALVAYLADLAP